MKTPWLKTKDPLVRVKELLPTRQITKWVGDNKAVVDINVKKSFLDNVVQQFKRMKENGVRVPFFKTHKEHPDNELGLVEDVFVKKNKKGQDSLYVKSKFHDKESMKAATKVDVSAWIPKKIVDGAKNVYEHALRHVAATSMPVVNGLEGWEGPVILSMEEENLPDVVFADGEPTGGVMDQLIDQILAKLGVTPPDGSDEAAKLRLILQAVGDLEFVEAEGDEEGALNLSQNPVALRQFKNSRETVIDQLVRERVLTPAKADTWKKKYCSNEAVSHDLQLSAEDSPDGETEFDRAVMLARDVAGDRPLAESGRSAGRQLSKEDRETNPLLAAATRAREAAGKQ